MAWFIASSLLIAGVAAVIGFFVMLFDRPRRRPRRPGHFIPGGGGGFGGGGGGGGGGFSGGGGSFGGGGASRRLELRPAMSTLATSVASAFLAASRTDHRTARRAFPPGRAGSDPARDRRRRTKHVGQVCFAVEAALPLSLVLQQADAARSARSRRSAGCASGTPSSNSGVLVYVLLADKDVEIVADRGIHRQVGEAAWRDHLPDDGVGVR